MLMKPSRKHKAQSAMEYLMTYGWAILIIAVVLGALFSLGVFSGNTLLGNACIASSGYYCQNPQYLHGTLGTGAAGNLIVTVGQNTGVNWATANFVFVPQGTATNGGVPTISFTSTPANTFNAVNGLVSGQTVSIYLPNNAITTAGATVTVGTAAQGAIWAYYTTATSSVPQYAQVASINIKAS